MIVVVVETIFKGIVKSHNPEKNNQRQPDAAPDLLAFVKAYVRTFKEADVFPEARTLLAATADATRRTALAWRALQARNIFPKTVAGAPLRSTGNCVI